jgi:c-di-GMP-related signal transduction protein
MNVCIARQPIFKKNENVYAYELLFRDGMSGAFPDISGDTATSRVLSNAFLEMGIEEITAGKKAFINFTEQLLTDGVPKLFPKTILTVEILEDVSPNDRVITACRDLADRGYEIALDDFLYRDELDPLIATAHIIKFDFRLAPMEKLIDDITTISGKGLKLLAEKVETRDEFEWAIRLGFDYFQGFFFSKPKMLVKTAVSPVKMALIEVIAEMNKEDFQITKLEKLISKDLSMSYKLMRYANSAYFKRVHEVSSIKHAVVLLGEMELRRFVSLMAMAALAVDKPEELVRESIIRAIFCESLGEGAGVKDASDQFTLGLFSLIDAILDQSMEEVMKGFPLDGDMKNALVNRCGPLSVYLNIADLYRSADWLQMEAECGKIGMDPSHIGAIYLKSLRKADRLLAL